MNLKYTNGNEPAFPVKNYCEHFEGLSILDYFAAKAMQGMLSAESLCQNDANKIAAWAYHQADEMLKTRAKAQPTTVQCSQWSKEHNFCPLSNQFKCGKVACTLPRTAP